VRHLQLVLLATALLVEVGCTAAPTSTSSQPPPNSAPTAPPAPLQSASRSQPRERGITATPYFELNGRPFRGGSLAQFGQAIDAELASVGR
jgi:hypothetical protein